MIPDRSGQAEVERTFHGGNRRSDASGGSCSFRRQVFPWTDHMPLGPRGGRRSAGGPGQLEAARRTRQTLVVEDESIIVKISGDDGTHSRPVATQHLTPEQDTPLPPQHLQNAGRSSGSFQVSRAHRADHGKIKMEAFRVANLRSLLRESRTDVAMAVDDPFPLVFGLADKSIISDQVFKASEAELEDSTFSVTSIGVDK